MIHTKDFYDFLSRYLSFSEINTFYKGMTTWIGAKEVFIESQRPKRKKGKIGINA